MQLVVVPVANEAEARAHGGRPGEVGPLSCHWLDNWFPLGLALAASGLVRAVTSRLHGAECICLFANAAGLAAAGAGLANGVLLKGVMIVSNNLIFGVGRYRSCVVRTRCGWQA